MTAKPTCPYVEVLDGDGRDVVRVSGDDRHVVAFDGDVEETQGASVDDAEPVEKTRFH